MIRLRRARAADMAGISDVAQGVWEQDILPNVCKAQIAGHASALWVAADQTEVVGFASAFLTVSLSGRGRWEIDLVAVRPDRQGRGLGTQLIRHISEAGERDQVALARALIRVENIASQRAFGRAGFTTDRRIHRLELWSPAGGGNVPPDQSETKRGLSLCAGAIALVPVGTLTYRGLWVEGLASAGAEEQRLALGRARGIAAREGRDNIGALVPLEKVSLLAPDLSEEGVTHGEYHWFVKPASKN